MTYSPPLTAALLRPQAQGRWLEIFQYLCPGMFDEAIENIGTHVTCPFHGGENDFRFLKRSVRAGRGNTSSEGVAMCSCGVYADGFAVLQKAMNVPFIEVLKRINEYLNGKNAAVHTFVPPVKVAKDDAHDAAEILAKVKKLWSAAKPLDLAKTTYYVKRGISAEMLKDLQDVRVNPGLAYYHKAKGKLEKIGVFPAILALMRDHEGNPVAIHRTWLSADQTAKAPVVKAKKLTETPGVSGAAIRLFDAKGATVLGLTEGIETALSVRELSAKKNWPELGKIPVWACFAERNIRSFIIPEDLKATLKKIVVFADNDEKGTGVEAALAFRKRMADEMPDLVVAIKVPNHPGWDWNDVHTKR